MQRYIRFARTIKPMLTKRAALLLRKSYIELRHNDLSYQKSSYRITVRQLESLIRLSEALARVDCSTEISEFHVREAARLLGNSILKVHKPDFELDTDDNLQNGEPKANGNMMQEEIDNKQKAGKIKLKSDEYNRIAMALIHKIQEDEKTAREGEQYVGTVQNDLVDWYVTKNINAVNSMEGYNNLTRILKSVINRLINKERLLMVAESAADESERRIKLHPNYTDQVDN